MLKLYEKNLIVENVACDEPDIVRLTDNGNIPVVLKNKYYYLCKKNEKMPTGFSGYVLVIGGDNKKIPKEYENVLLLKKEFEYLESGDIIRFNPGKPSLTVLYRKNSANNYFLITERCNSFCVMCSQPPRDITDDYHIDDILKAIPLIDRNTNEISLTGGEPTLIGDRLVHMIKQFKNYLPFTSLHVLTNGRLFSRHDFTSTFESIGHHDCMFGIPLYSDSPEIHNYIVQSQGAFDETIKGILNLKKYGQKVEIRVVVQRDNYARLKQLAQFISRNLTFVDQVVFMGLEPTGFAKVNMDALWIDPHDYQNELADAIRVLGMHGIHAKIYNVQLCLLDESIASYSTKSISDWKKEFDDQCKECVKSESCCGMFGTGTGKHSKYISAFR